MTITTIISYFSLNWSPEYVACIAFFAGLYTCKYWWGKLQEQDVLFTELNEQL